MKLKLDILPDGKYEGATIFKDELRSTISLVKLANGEVYSMMYPVDLANNSLTPPQLKEALHAYAEISGVPYSSVIGALHKIETTLATAKQLAASLGYKLVKVC